LLSRPSVHICARQRSQFTCSPHVSGNASRWTARAPSPKVLAEVNPSAEAATRAAQREACPETKKILKTWETKYQKLGPNSGERGFRSQSPGENLRMRRYPQMRPASVIMVTESGDLGRGHVLGLRCQVSLNY
jgi:hypothetical protein